MGLIGTLTTGGGQQVREQIILDSYRWNATTGGTLTLYLRNVGSSEVIVDAIYIGGQVVSTNMGTTLPVQGPVITIDLAPPGTYTSGVSYTAKIITKTGGVFSYAVIFGSTG